MDLANRITLALAAAILIHQLFVPPVIGLADNGDFWKLTFAFDLVPAAEDEVRFAPTVYTFDRSRHHWSRFYSSETLLMIPAFLLHFLFTDSPSFDIRVLGLVHSLLYLLALWLVLPFTRSLGRVRRVTVLALILLVSGDVMYVCYLNSFSMDTAALLFLLLAAGFALRAAHHPNRSDAVLLVVCGALLTASKAQHCIAGTVLAAFFIWKGRTLWPGGSRVFPVTAAAALLAVSAAVLLLASRDYSAFARYSTIFYQILPRSKTPDRDLQELGLNSSYKRYIGTHAYQAESALSGAEGLRAFRQSTSYTRLALFFARHPEHALYAVKVGLEQAAIGRTPMLGNFDRSAGRPPHSQSQSYAWWSSLKRRAFEFHPWLFLGWVAGLAALACGFFGRAFPVVWALAAMTAGELLTASLGDAIEMTRHLFLFNAMADILLIGAAAGLRFRGIN